MVMVVKEVFNFLFISPPLVILFNDWIKKEMEEVVEMDRTDVTPLDILAVLMALLEVFSFSFAFLFYLITDVGRGE